jgi:hypothetical protein
MAYNNEGTTGRPTIAEAARNPMETGRAAITQGRWEGAPRPMGVGRERKDNATSSAILDEYQVGFKSGRRHPDRFVAAKIERVMRHAGRSDIAWDIAQAFSLYRRSASPSCKCYVGLVAMQAMCQACQGYRKGAWE